MTPCTCKNLLHLQNVQTVSAAHAPLFNGYQGLFPPEGKLTKCLHLLLGLGIPGAILPLPIHLMAREVTTVSLPLPDLSMFDTLFYLRREILPVSNMQCFRLSYFNQKVGFNSISNCPTISKTTLQTHDDRTYEVQYIPPVNGRGLHAFRLQHTKCFYIF